MNEFWVKGTIFFPKRIKNIIVTFRDIERMSLAWVNDLNDQTFRSALIALFSYLKDHKFLPTDSQLHACGKLWNRDVLFFTVFSEKFDELPEGNEIPCEDINFERREL